MPRPSIPYRQSLQKIHTWNPNEFLTEKNLYSGERGLCVLTEGEDEERQHPACWSSHCLHASVGFFGGPVDEEGRYIWRHIHTQKTFPNELLALCLLMNGFFRHTGALRVTKAEENKGTLGQAQTGAFPGDKCLSQLERRHTSGEYGKIY